MRTHFGKYVFNEHKVCLNPDTIEIDSQTRVKVAQCGDDSWVYGFSYAWGGSPCMRDIEVCTTKDDAIRECLMRLNVVLSRHKDCKASAKLIREKLFETRQLTLF